MGSDVVDGVREEEVVACGFAADLAGVYGNGSVVKGDGELARIDILGVEVSGEFDESAGGGEVKVGDVLGGVA